MRPYLVVVLTKIFALGLLYKTVLLNYLLHFLNYLPPQVFFSVWIVSFCVFFFCFFIFLPLSLYELDKELMHEEVDYDLLLFFRYFFSTDFDLLFSCLCLLSVLFTSFSCDISFIDDVAAIIYPSNFNVISLVPRSPV